MRSVPCVLVLILLVARPAYAGAPPVCLRIASLAEAPDDDFGSPLGKALYEEAGLCATVVRLPTERLRRMLDKGELDGVVLRTPEFLQTQPELVTVPTPLIVAIGRLYWRASQPRPEGGSHKVGFPRGWAWPRSAAQSLGLDAVEVDNIGSLLKMTETGRIDGCLMAEYEFDNFAHSEEERRLFASAPVFSVRLFHAVSRGHIDLLPALDAAVLRLEARGDVKRLVRDHPAD